MKLTKNINEANAITHDGIIHADEIMGAVILEERNRKKELVLCRVSKLPNLIPKDAIVFDIGGGFFDHHQRGGNGERFNGVPYASAGLIWEKYGRDILRDVPKEYVNYVWRFIDKELISGIDAVDNGVYPKVSYPAKLMSISAAISSFNPAWDSEESYDEAFAKAFEFARTIFDNCLETAIAEAKAKSIVDEAIEKSEDGILILDKFVPWFKFIHNSRNPKAAELLFAIYPSNRGGFNWQCITKGPATYEVRKSVPEEWWGAKPDDLFIMTGAMTASFCHQKGFIGGAETLEDTIKMVRAAIKA